MQGLQFCQLSSFYAPLHLLFTGFLSFFLRFFLSFWYFFLFRFLLFRFFCFSFFPLFTFFFFLERRCTSLFLLFQDSALFLYYY
ncbi:MAG: hypothetical protein E3J78_03950, partial [Candidatus Cloacimonadota bacterium]